MEENLLNITFILARPVCMPVETTSVATQMQSNNDLMLITVGYIIPEPAVEVATSEVTHTGQMLRHQPYNGRKDKLPRTG